MGIESLPCDELAGYVVQVDGTGTALICGAPYGPLPGEVLHHGPMVLRYGIPLLLKKDTLLVEWVFDDFRREHRGDAALDFNLRRGDLFPRADVGGFHVTTGKPAEIFLKQLDLALGLWVYAYRSDDLAGLVSRIGAAVWLDARAAGWEEPPLDDGRIPALLRRAVPCWVVHPGALCELPQRLPAEEPG